LKVVKFKPGTAPINNLSIQLYEVFKNECNKSDVLNKDCKAQTIKDCKPQTIIEAIQNKLSLSFFGLIKLFKEVIQLSDSDKCLINIDQFEEIFRYKPKNQIENEAAAFVYLLEKTIKQKEIPPIYCSVNSVRLYWRLYEIL